MLARGTIVSTKPFADYKERECSWPSMRMPMFGVVEGPFSSDLTDTLVLRFPGGQTMALHISWVRAVSPLTLLASVGVDGCQELLELAEST